MFFNRSLGDCLVGIVGYEGVIEDWVVYEYTRYESAKTSE